LSRRLRIALFLPALAILGALTVWALTGLPDFGNYVGPYGYLLNRVVTPERHMTNAVTAIVFDYRGFDTMGEEFILFAAVTGVVLLLRETGGEEEDEPADEVTSDGLRLFGMLALAAGTLVALWLIAYGLVTPGGGFQGGVALASGALLLYLVTSRREWSAFADETRLDPLEGIGAGGYAVIGLAPIFASLPFLTNFLGHGSTGTVFSAGSAAFVNWSAGIEVAAANLVLYSEYLDQYVRPIVLRLRK
jgi:multicomponent Na+:H+ antiporter subunit B